METAEMESKVAELEELVKKVDVDTGHSKKHLLLRAKNLAATLLDPYVLFHTKIVVSLVRKRGGDAIDEVTAWLHDIGRSVTDKGHREVGAIWVAKWLKKFYITDEEMERILDGIRNHGTKDEPKTETGRMLKLVDALAVFDPGWATMIVEYYRSVGKAGVGERQILKKWTVAKEMGSKEEVEDARRMMGMLNIAAEED